MSSLRGLARQFFNYGIEQALKLKKQPEGLSYIEVKSYILPPCGFACRLPVRMWLTIDFCSLLILSLLLTAFSPIFIYVSLLIFLCIIIGTLLSSLDVVKKSGELKWLLLYPMLHLVRNYSWIIGRICGSVKHRFITI
jgi:hypothetical protein